jgi:hypothetical protein
LKPTGHPLKADLKICKFHLPSLPVPDGPAELAAEEAATPLDSWELSSHMLSPDPDLEREGLHHIQDEMVQIRKQYIGVYLLFLCLVHY